jgi:acyl-CoA synthetase (AMP-forming)/AMP-acid ligase II
MTRDPASDHRAPSGAPGGAGRGGWCYADVWETVAATVPGRPALVHGERSLAWGDFDRRASGLAGALLGSGAARQDKVACYLHNCPEYLEVVFAALKAGLVPVNTNYRYRSDELVRLWDDADAVAVAFHGAFAQTVASLRHRVPKVRTWLWVDDGSGPCPSWAVAYEEAVAAGGAGVAPWGRSGDDLLMIYTGGTTGLPKGVMWRQDDCYRAFNTQGDPPSPDLAAVARRVRSNHAPVGLPASPLMHATGLMFALTVLNLGGTVVTVGLRHLDAAALLDEVARRRVELMAVVGDAFARPMLEELDAHPGARDLSSLAMLVSSGVSWSREVKEGLLRHLPGCQLVDLLGSSEAHGMASSVSRPGGVGEVARFRLGANALVVTEDGRTVAPGSGEAGLLAVRGPIPLGYYKDPDKTARTFRVVDGERVSVPGDWATVEADGTIRLLGRGSLCINSGGEKVFPEEVEAVLTSHPHVRDALVVAVAHPRLGETVCAVVELQAPRAAPLAPDELVQWVRARLAGYKVPRRVVVVEAVPRAPNGKADYAAARRLAGAAPGPG